MTRRAASLLLRRSNVKPDELLAFEFWLQDLKVAVYIVPSTAMAEAKIMEVENFMLLMGICRLDFKVLK